MVILKYIFIGMAMVGGVFGSHPGASNNLVKGFNTPTGGGSTTGVASSTLLVDNNTFSGATTTITGVTVIGTGASTPTLGGYIHPYLRVGTTTCPTNTTFYGYLEVCGSDYSTNGVQAQIGNTANGTKSFAGLSLLNDKSDTNLTNYAGIFYNSSAYTDTTFGTLFATPYEYMSGNSNGPTTIFSATSTASADYIQFATGLTSQSEVGRFISGGQLGIGTTTPSANFLLDVQGNGIFSGNTSMANLTATGTATISGNASIGTTSQAITGLTVSPTVFVPELNLATSSTIFIGVASSSQQRISYGNAAITLSVSAFQLLAGMKTAITTCGPSSGTGGAITWSNLRYSGGVQPGNTTTANQCDIWYITATQATSTTIAVLTGMTPGIQ